MFRLSAIDQRPQLEADWQGFFNELRAHGSGRSSQEFVALMRQTVTRQPERHDMTCAGMLYALLVSNDDEARQQIWRQLVGVAMDELRCVVKDLLYVTSSHWDELEPVTAQSIIWILEQLIASDKEQATELAEMVLRQTHPGDTSFGNIEVLRRVIKILNANRGIFQPHPIFTAKMTYFLLRAVPEHVDPQLEDLQLEEAALALWLLRHRMDHCRLIGRDLVRALIDVGNLPMFSSFMTELLLMPDSLLPGFGGVPELMSQRTPAEVLLMRVPTAMLRDMKFMFRRLTNENFLLHGSWFQQRHLSSPLSHLSVGDIIRYIIIGHVPTNESLQSPSLKRWRLIDYLLSNITRFPPAVQSAKMALFFDWLAFEDERSIMDVEPAALLLEHQLTSNSTSPAEKYGLLEFLLLLVSEMLPQQKAQFQASAMRALAACESKHVVDGFFLLLQSTAFGHRDMNRVISASLPALADKLSRPLTAKSTSGNAWGDDGSGANAWSGAHSSGARGEFVRSKTPFGDWDDSAPKSSQTTGRPAQAPRTKTPFGTWDQSSETDAAPSAAASVSATGNTSAASTTAVSRTPFDDSAMPAEDTTAKRGRGRPAKSHTLPADVPPLVVPPERSAPAPPPAATKTTPKGRAAAKAPVPPAPPSPAASPSPPPEPKTTRGKSAAAAAAAAAVAAAAAKSPAKSPRKAEPVAKKAPAPKMPAKAAAERPAATTAPAPAKRPSPRSAKQDKPEEAAVNTSEEVLVTAPPQIKKENIEGFPEWALVDTTKRTAKLNAAATIQALTADDSPRRGAAGSNVNGVAAKRGAAAAASKSASASKRTRRSRKEESEDEEEDAEDDDFELDEDEEESDDDDNDDEYNASDDEDDDDVELDGEMEEAEFRAGDYDGEVLSTGGDDVAHMDVIPEEDEDASEGGAATPENVITATTNGRGRPSAAAAKKPATTRGKTGEATASAAVERAEAAPANKRGKVGPAAARGAAANRGRSAAPPAPVFQKIRPSANERFPWKLQPGLPLTEEEQKIALPAAEENVKPLSPRKKHLAYKPSAKQRPSQPGTRRWDKFLPPGFVDDDGAEAAAEGEAAAPETVEVSPSLHPLLRDIPQCEKLKGLAADNWRNMLDDGDVDALLVPHSNGDGGAAQAQDGAKNGKEGNHDDNDGESYDKDESHNDGDVHPEGEKDDEGREMDAGPMESATDDVGSLMDTNHPPEGRDTVVVGAAE